MCKKCFKKKQTEKNKGGQETWHQQGDLQKANRKKAERVTICQLGAHILGQYGVQPG